MNFINENMKSIIKKGIDDLYNNLQDIDELLDGYNPGRPEHKPDVLKQIEEIKIQREEIIKQQQQQHQQQHQQQQQVQIQEVFNNMTNKINELTLENTKLKETNDYLNKKINELIKTVISEKTRKNNEVNKIV